MRLGAIAIGLLALALATRVTITTAAWVGRVFPGFLLLDNRVVASIGLARWSGTGVPGLYQSEVVAVDGRPVESSAEAYQMVATRAPGTPVHYRLRWRGEERDVTVAAQRFVLSDWVLLFGAYLLNAAVYLASGLVVWVLRPRAPLGRALLLFGGTCCFWFLTAMDLYAPATFFRLHIAFESLLPATGFHLGLLFPQPHPFAGWVSIAYLVSLGLLVPYELFLYRPTAYTVVHNLADFYLGLAALFFLWRLVREYWRAPSALARQRTRVMTIGTLLAFALPGVLLVLSALMGGGVAINAGAFTPFLFALSLAYAIVKHDLFEIDAMVKRGAYYLLLTGSVSAAYVGAVVLFNLTLQAGAVTDSPAFPVAFTLAVLVLFNPIRTRLQAFVDRVFFNTRYDGARVLAAVGSDLSSALKRDHIVRLVRECVDAAIPNAGTRLFVRRPDEGGLREVSGGATVAPALAGALADGRVRTAFDSPEQYPDPASHEAMRDALAGLGAEVAVPLQLRGDLIGVLTGGPKRSGLFYTAGDAEFLRALAQQAAIALQNAESYEALIELNAGLEERVRQRTAELEAANQDLTAAYKDLRAAQVQLVQSEKMASLGRLVAGVAHEINNPVSFIATSVVPLRRRLEKAVATAPSEVARLIREAEELVDIMARGAERTAAIVKDLRSFSRLGEAVRKPVDLHEGLEVSLRLLEPRWRERITIHRDFGQLPLVDCDPGQLNQVFMNVLANACDAITGAGNIWITTRADGDTVTVAVRDDGGGIPPAVLDRIFDPFFTTKEVGSGTGLGLAISHSVVAAHGGRIEVESVPGATTFRIVLPIEAEVASLDRAASGDG